MSSPHATVRLLLPGEVAAACALLAEAYADAPHFVAAAPGAASREERVSLLSTVCQATASSVLPHGGLLGAFLGGDSLAAVACVKQPRMKMTPPLVSQGSLAKRVLRSPGSVGKVVRGLNALRKFENREFGERMATYVVHTSVLYVAVAAEHRRQGLATALLEAALDAADEQAIPVGAVEWGGDASEPALFLASLGFRPITGPLAVPGLEGAAAQPTARVLFREPRRDAGEDNGGDDARPVTPIRSAVESLRRSRGESPQPREPARKASLLEPLRSSAYASTLYPEVRPPASVPAGDVAFDDRAYDARPFPAAPTERPCVWAGTVPLSAARAAAFPTAVAALRVPAAVNVRLPIAATDDGQWVLFTPLPPGAESLEAVLGGAGLTPDAALLAARSAAHALAHLHDENLLHGSLTARAVVRASPARWQVLLAGAGAGGGAASPPSPAADCAALGALVRRVSQGAGGDPRLDRVAAALSAGDATARQAERTLETLHLRAELRISNVVSATAAAAIPE